MMSRSLSLVLVLVAAAATLTLSPSAFAQEAGGLLDAPEGAAAGADAPAEDIASLTPEQRKAKAETLYDEAVKLYDEGKVVESAQTLERAYDYDPNTVLAYNIGKAYDDAADLEKAGLWYALALESEDLGETERRKATKAMERIGKTNEQLDAIAEERRVAEEERQKAEALRKELEKENAETKGALDKATEGYERHDGFFARLTFGLGYVWNTTTLDEKAPPLDRGSLSGTAKVKSVNLDAEVAFGWAFWDDFVIHLTLLTMGMASPNTNEPDLKVNSLTVGGGGLGATYYFTPLNLYLSGTLGFLAGNANFTRTEKNQEVTGDVSTDAGLALELLVGEEWWVSESWGIGAGARFVYSNISTPTDIKIVKQLPGGVTNVTSSKFDTQFKTFAFTIAFSTTFN